MVPRIGLSRDREGVEPQGLANGLRCALGRLRRVAFLLLVRGGSTMARTFRPSDALSCESLKGTAIDWVTRGRLRSGFGLAMVAQCTVRSRQGPNHGRRVVLHIEVSSEKGQKAEECKLDVS